MTVLENSSGKLISTATPRLSFPSRAMPLGTIGSHASGAIALGPGMVISYAQLYREHPWMAIGVNKISRLIASLPLRVYEPSSTEGRKEVTSGPLFDLLRTPWVRGSSMSLKQAFAFPILLQGNSVIAKVRGRRAGPPTSFIPLLWQFLVPQLDGANSIQFWQTNQTGQAQFLDLTDVIHTAWKAPDGELGVSPFQQLGTTIALDVAEQRYAQRAFENSLRPSGALVAGPDNKMKTPEVKELQQQVEEQYGGIDNAGKIMMLGNGLDWKPFAQTASEAQLVEGRKLNREEIAAVFDIPPPMIGILEKATFSNVEQQHLMLYTDVLNPWLSLIAETIQAQLIDPEPAFQGLEVEFDLNERTKGDPEKRINAFSKAIESGIYTINEAREKEGLPRYEHPDADKPMIQRNNLRPVGTPADPEPVPGAEPEPPEPTKAQAATHLIRARDRALTLLGAGADDLFDRERFERELTEDGSDPESAAMLAEVVAGGISTAAGDPDRIKQFFSALGA
jgi:HK97 family phage portal protein